MIYKFQCFGHENIRATHRNTFEITRDENLTKTGNCIVGVKANFELKKLLPFLKINKCKITLTANKLKEETIFTPNKDFNDEHELVIRLGTFVSKRTLGSDADKSSLYFKRDFVKTIQNNEQKIEVILESIND